MNTIEIKVNGRDLSVYPNTFGLPDLQEFDEFTTHSYQRISELSKRYFDQKEKAAKFAHTSITCIASSLAGISVMGGFPLLIYLSTFSIFAIPFLVAFILISFLFGGWAGYNEDILDSRAKLPKSEMELKSAIMDNIAFANKDHSELKRTITERIENIGKSLDLTVSAKMNAPAIMLNKMESLKWTLKCLDDDVNRIRNAIQASGGI